MKTQTKKGIIIGIVLTVVAVVIIAVLSLITVFGVLSATGLLPSIQRFFETATLPDPEQPEIAYAEFPFALECEIDGEIKTFEDTLVIEHIGVGWNEEYGKQNIWNRYLKSREEKEYLRHNVVLFDNLLENGTAVMVYFELGSCEYYMGLEASEYYDYSFANPGEIVLLTNEYQGAISTDDLYERYGIDIKIIKKELSSPIGPKE